MTTVQRARIAVSPPIRDLLDTQREHGHVHVMAAYRREVGENPRKQLGVLWHIDRHSGILTVQSSEPPESPALLGDVRSTESVRIPGESDTIDLAVDRNCQKSPRLQIPEALRLDLERRDARGCKTEKAYRSRPIIVPEQERQSWAIGRLAAIGLEVVAESMKLGSLKFASLNGARRGIPYIQIRARGRVTDAEKFGKALLAGFGKGRNYGLGLIRIDSASAV